MTSQAYLEGESSASSAEPCRARDFYARIPSRFLKDPMISPDAKLLWALLKVHADVKTGRTYVKGETLERILNWGRRKREKAQAELCEAGWLRLEWKRGTRGRWARRIYLVCEGRSTVAQFQRSGETDHLISSHSQSGKVIKYHKPDSPR